MADIENQKGSNAENLKIKEEIASKYIDKFKKEIGWLKSLAISPIENKLKKIMVSGEDLKGKKFEDLDDLGFWRKILGFLTPNMSIEIFNFLKEKQEAIVRAETTDRLDDLMTEVVTGKKPKENSPGEEEDQGATSSSGESNPEDDEKNDDGENDNGESDDGEGDNTTTILTASTLTYGGLAMGAKKIDKMRILKKNPGLKEIQKAYNTIIDGLSEQLDNPKLLASQKQNIKNSIKQFEIAKSESSNLKSVLGDLDQLSKKGIMNVSELGSLSFGKSEIKLLKNLTEDKAFLKQLSLLKDEKQIASVLSQKGIKNIPTEFIQVIKKAKTLEEVTSVVKVASSIKTISKAAKILRAIPFLDVIGAGFDVFTYLDESKEADLIKKSNQIRGENKQDQATLHLVTGMADAVMGLTALAVSTPPVGRIALGVAAVGVTVNQVMDTYYFDVVDFYTQNKEDYKSKYRTELKNAIYQATIHGEDSIDNSFADKFADTFNFSESIKKSENLSLQDAYWAMIYQEEISTGKYNNILNINPEFPKEAKSENIPTDAEKLKNYKQDRERLLKKIQDRMSYIQKFLPGNNKYTPNSEYTEFIQNIKFTNGINYIEKIIGDSKIYADMIETTDPSLQGAETIKEYKDKIKESLISKDEKAFANLEKIHNKDKYEFLEIYINSNAYYKYLSSQNKDEINKLIADGTYTREEYNLIKNNCEFIEQYYKYRFDGEAIESKISTEHISKDVDYVNTKSFLLDIQNQNYIKPMGLKDSDVTKMFQTEYFGDARLDNNIEVSDSTGQNIIYEIAKKLHGYTGHNNELELINFFQEEKSDTLGIYYSDARHINLNNELDLVTFTLDDFENKTAQESINYLFTYLDGDSGQKVQRSNILNTTTDNGDGWLNKGYIKDVSDIIKSEKLNSSEDYQKSTQDEIADFIKGNSDGKYIEIPYSLIARGIKCHMGDLRKYLFKHENNNIVAITRGDLLDNTLDFGEYKVSYESVGKTREKLSEPELKLIQQVDDVHAKLESLRGVEELSILGGAKEGDLDIPQELEIMISQQWLERQNVKTGLLYTSSYNATTTLKTSHAKYYKYFNNLYLGLLTVVNHSKISNDVDNITYFKQALSLTNIDIITIKEGSLSLQEGILSDKQDKVFKKLLDEKVPGEDVKIVDLAKSKSEEDQNKAKYYAQEIIQSIIETSNLSFDKEGKISDINSPIEEFTKENAGVFLFGGLGYLVSSGLYSSKEAKSLDDRLKYNLSLPYTDSGKIKNELDIKLDTESPSINKVSDSQITTYHKINNITDDIIATANNIDLAGQRGKIELIPDMDGYQGDIIPAKLNSWNSSIDILINQDSTVKIKGLDIQFSNEEEAIRTANFINKMKGDQLVKHPDHKGLFQFSRTGNLEVNDGYVLDTTILKSSTLEDKFPTVKGSKKFIEYLNQL